MTAAAKDELLLAAARESKSLHEALHGLNEDQTAEVWLGTASPSAGTRARLRIRSSTPTPPTTTAGPPTGSAPGGPRVACEDSSTPVV